MFCLDIADGRELWRLPAPLPVWGSPSAYGPHVYFGLGNGRLTESVQPPDKPAGAVLCVEAATGKEVWRHEVGDGVMVQPTVDERHVYFGSRDGHAFGLDRVTGREVWKHDAGSPVVANVAAAAGLPDQVADVRLGGCVPVTAARSVLAIGSAGKVFCLDAGSGRVQWSFDLAPEGLAPELLASPAVSVRREGAGEHRQFLFGAGLRSPVSGSIGRVYCLEDQY
jgi:outer membrane protein assembly factor BamB